MILGITTLAIAILISAVSAYYSILGLTAIFASAAIPVMIMGGALEAGKVITAVWLHTNWKRAELQYKLYLVPAICFLMLLTSMGVFGFLSKAHLDQAVPSGDIAAQVQIFDDKIKTERDNIDSARKALAQLDTAVDQTMARSTSEDGATKSANLRRGQQRERSQLQNDIARAQKNIVKLQEDRAPIASQMRKVEAEVGPIKYVAAMLYGDNPDANVLERAVRWVIVLIVIVFDPLAIVLILAGIKQLEWSRGTNVVESSGPEYYPMSGEGDVATATLDELIDEITPENPHSVAPPIVDINQQGIDNFVADANRELAEAEEPKEPEYAVIEDADCEEEPAPFSPYVPYQSFKEIVTGVPTKQPEYAGAGVPPTTPYTEVKIEQPRLTPLELEDLFREEEPEPTYTAEPIFIPRISVPESNVVLEESHPETGTGFKAEVIVPPETAPRFKAPIEIVEPVVEEPTAVIDSPNAPGLDASDERPGDYLKPAEVAIPVREPRVGFGTIFPNDPEKGDMYMRTDFKPSRLFKWNDRTWLEVNKNSTNVYSYDAAYMQFLADKVLAGEYSIDDLNEQEQTNVRTLLGAYR